MLRPLARHHKGPSSVLLLSTHDDLAKALLSNFRQSEFQRGINLPFAWIFNNYSTRVDRPVTIGV